MPAVSHLTCEGLSDPNLIVVASPRFGWRITSEARGARQTAYQLRVVELSPRGEPVEGGVIETPRVDSGESQWVSVPGLVTKSKTRYRWQVRTWDEAGRESAWSMPAFFETGLRQEAWLAAWIGDGRVVARDQPVGARYFRKDFDLPSAAVRARLYVSAFGLVEPWLNGARISSDCFSPGWPEYRRRVFYVAYDVTDRLRAGRNALGLILADGWFSSALMKYTQFGEQPIVSAFLELTDAEGKVTKVATDATWKWAEGPIVEQSIYHGETYDARRADPLWCETHVADTAAPDAGAGLPAVDASCPASTSAPWQWRPVTLRGVGGIAITARFSQPVQEIEEVRPISHRETRPGVFLYDMGQNMVGHVRLKLRAPAGTTVEMKFAEMLEQSDKLHTANLRSARATARYVARGGDAVETWEPQFTFFGFRYVEVTGLEQPEPDAITGVVVHTAMPRIGEFSCSNPMLNQLFSNTLWGQKGNFLEVPTDCPQRNERLGWTGDAQVFAHTASYNYNTGAFYRQWLRTLRDSYRDDPDGASGFADVAPDTGLRYGSAGWGDAAVIVPYVAWLHTGDRRLLEEAMESIQTWVEAQTRDYPDGIRRSPRSYGDWLAPWSPTREGPTPYVLIATAYYAHVTDLAARIAEQLGRTETAERNRTLFRHIKAAFAREFIKADGQVFSDEQTAYLLALAFNLVPDELRSGVVGNLVRTIHAKDDHLATGFLGTPLLMPVLSSTGNTDLAYKVLLQESYPGWLFSVKNGATTVWERWDSWTPENGFHSAGMNSFNHYAYGCVVGWLYDTVTGLKPDASAPGWKKFHVAPTPGGGLTHAKASVVTPYGHAKSEWRITGGQFELAVTVPPNAQAVVSMPASAVRDVTEGGRALDRISEVTDVSAADGRVVFTIPAGTYQFSTPVIGRE